MNVLSLFDGISCGQVALHRANIKYNRYYASEIKKNAIKVTQYHFPKTIQLGNVESVNFFGLPNIDLLMGGSPCKGISRLNRNQEGLDHIESKLFWEYIRIKKELNPKYFLLENTHGCKEATNIITKELGVYPISINSKLVSAQNRPRYYWTNIPGISQPLDKGLTTESLNNSFYSCLDRKMVPQNRIKWIESPSGKKSILKGYTKINPFPKYGCITANGHKKWNENYIYDGFSYRFLSHFELEWLQTLPAGYTYMLNYDDAYDVIGDGWTVDVISHILSFIPKTK